MKILYAHTGFIDTPTPSSTFIMNRVLGLSRIGVEVKLVIRKKTDKSTEVILKEIFGINCEKETFEVLAVQETEKEFLKKLYNRINENFLEYCLYTRNLKILSIFCKIKGKFNNNIFFESHDYYLDLFLRKDEKKIRLIKKYYYEKKYLRKINGLICVNESQIELYNKKLNIPMIAISSGIINKDNVNLVNKKLENKLAYIGSLDKRKNIEQIIKLMKYLPRDYKLIIFGGKNKQEIEEINKLIKEYNLENKIEITGWIDKVLMSKKMSDVKLGLIPLEDNFFNRYLTYPLKLSDYFANNLPVLTNNYPSSKSYLKEGETGFFVEWNDLDKIKNIILNIFSDKKLYENMQEEIKKFKEKNSIENNSRKLLEFLNKESKKIC